MITKTITLTLNEFLTLKSILIVEIRENNKQINKLKHKKDKNSIAILEMYKEDNETIKQILTELE